MFRFLQPQRRGIGFQSLGLVAADCGKGSKDGRAQNKLSHEKKDRALVAVSSEGVVTHASQTKKRRSCSPTGTPAFGTEYQRSPPRKSFGSRTPPRVASHLVCSNCLCSLLGRHSFFASRLETDGVESSMLALFLPSTARPRPSFYRPSIAAGTFDSLHLLGAPPKGSLS